MPRPPGSALLGMGLALVGWSLDAEPLTVAGVALAFAALAAWAWVAAAARGAEISRRVGARTVVEGDPLSVEVTAHGRVGFPGGEIVERLLDSPVPVRRARRHTEVKIQVRFDRRGPRRLPAPRLVLRDPLGAVRRERLGPAPDDVLVLPRIEPVTWRHRWVGERGVTDRRGTGDSDGVDFDGLRPHRPGAPATRIHWPAYARGAGLLERRMAPEAGARALVVLDPGVAALPARLDVAVRAAASLCLDLARSGGCSLLVPGDLRPRRVDGGGAWPAAWAALARVTGRRRPALGAARHAGAVYLVTPRAPRRLPAPLAGRSVVVVSPVAGEAPRGSALLEVAGCAGYASAARQGRAA